MWGFLGSLQRSEADTGRKCRPRESNPQPLSSFRLVYSEILLGWRPGLRRLFNILTNAIFRYFILFILPTVLFGIIGTAKRHSSISAHVAWDRRSFVVRPPCCVTCACSCMTYSWRRGSKLSTSKWDTQTDVHDLLIWLSWSRWFLFISGFSWFANESDGKQTSCAHEKRKALFCSRYRNQNSGFWTSSGSSLTSKQLLLETLKMCNQTHD